ncbi:MAG: sensor histidine kinase, partial [Sphingomonadales bacterium]
EELDKLVTAISMLYCAGDMPWPKVECTVSEAPLTVLGIESRLGQVLRNLIENARSFCPEEGVVDIGLSKDAGFVLLSVTDEGPGIPEESLDKIFERFYTERPDSEAFGTHSGLGRSISKQIVEAHGGTIKADNRAEGGARFVVRLPALK